MLEHGDAKTAAEKWRAAAALYDEIGASEEAQACRDKISSLPPSASSTPKAAPGASRALAPTSAAAAAGAAPGEAGGSSFLKLKQRLLGNEPIKGKGGLLEAGDKDEEENERMSSAADLQVWGGRGREGGREGRGAEWPWWGA